MQNKTWMLYGCTGYSGKLIAQEAHRRGLKPILAGRSASNTKTLAHELGLPYRVFDLSDPLKIKNRIEDCFMLFNAAGPFSATGIPMLEACISTKTHYLSLAGDVPILQEMHGYHARARQADIVLGVGLGFDVIPTDCIAAVLKEAMPDATHLTLGFDGMNTMSAGSTKEFLESLAEPFWARRNGKLVPFKMQSREERFGDEKKFAMTLVWGDAVSAFYSTGIPNIDIFISASRTLVGVMRALYILRPLFQSSVVRHGLNNLIDKWVDGPSYSARTSGVTNLFGEVQDSQGNRKRVTLKTASEYELTYLGALHGIEHVLKHTPPGGYYTPSQLLGARAIEEIDGSTKIEFVH